MVGRFSVVHSRSQYTDVKPDSAATFDALYDFQHSAPLQKKTTGCDLSSLDSPSERICLRIEVERLQALFSVIRIGPFACLVLYSRSVRTSTSARPFGSTQTPGGRSRASLLWAQPE